MSNSHISDRLRQKVANRAEHLCEYCLIHEEECILGCKWIISSAKSTAGKQ
jgi:hypothetical protein